MTAESLARGFQKVREQKNITIRYWRGRAEAAEAAVEQVRAVHPRVERPHGEPRCDHCDLLWPCPTIQALDGESQ